MLRWLTQAKLQLVVMCTVVLTLLLSAIPGPSEAVRTRQIFDIWNAYPYHFTINLGVDGWDSSQDPSKIWIERIIADGVIYNQAWWRSQGVPLWVMLSEGKLYEGSTTKLTFYNYDLSSYPVLIDQADEMWWGGEMFPQMYMGKSTINKEWADVVYHIPGSVIYPHVQVTHTFYSNGWQYVL